MLSEKGFVFIDEKGDSYKCQKLEGSYWLLYWNNVYKCWTTLRTITVAEIEKYRKWRVYV